MPRFREFARRLVAAGCLAALLFACGPSGDLLYDGTITLDLSAPVAAHFDGPAMCEISPAGYNVWAPTPFQIGADLVSPDVHSVDGTAVAVGVNGQLGYAGPSNGADVRVSVANNGLEGTADFHDVASGAGWLGGVDHAATATGSITWRCGGAGNPVSTEGPGG